MSADNGETILIIIVRVGSDRCLLPMILSSHFLALCA